MTTEQLSFNDCERQCITKQTPRQRFLAAMERVIPWSNFVREVVPYYPRVGRQGSRPASPLENMVRIYFIQQFYGLSDPGVENELKETH